MKKLCLCVLLLLIASVINADGALFTLAPDQPAVPHGKPGAWDATYTDPGAVFYADGKFNMFRNGFNGWPASVQIGYATSDDGLKWTEVGSDPVLLSKDVSYAKVAALASDGMVMDDGTWVLYFYTWNSMSESTSPGAIGRATAPAPAGPWTPDPAPILNPGSKGTWDELRLSAPRIVKTEDGYRMYYTGYDHTGIGSGKIGMATSKDGITWTKYDDPATTDPLYAESDPIMVSTTHLDFNQPMVEQTPDGWVMTFRQVDFSKGQPQMGLNDALSDDGIHWNIASAAPFWTRSTVPGSNGFWYTAMEYHAGTYFQYIETGVGSHTQIYVATHTGSLKPGS